MFDKFRKKKHFKKQLRTVQEGIWNIEFQREKLRFLREDIRGQYDRLNETTILAKRKIDEEKKGEKPNDQSIKNLEAVIEKYKPDLEYKLKQIQGLDNEISAEDNPNSCENRIDGLRALRIMYLDYLKRI